MIILKKKAPSIVTCKMFPVLSYDRGSRYSCSVVKYFLVKNEHDSSILRYLYIKYSDVKLGISKVTQKKNW